MAKTLKVGNKVEWLCSPRGKKPFKCTGVIGEIKTIKFGGKSEKLGARLAVKKGSKYHKEVGRLGTVVAVEKLKEV